jgi:hypothetical protein
MKKQPRVSMFIGKKSCTFFCSEFDPAVRRVKVSLDATYKAGVLEIIKSASEDRPLPENTSQDLLCEAVCAAYQVKVIPLALQRLVNQLESDDGNAV